MANSKNSLNGMFTDDELQIGKLLVMKANHGVAIEDMERLTKSNLREIENNLTTIDQFVYSVMHNSFEAIGQPHWGDLEIYVANGSNPSSSFLRTAEPDKVIGTFEFDADEIKHLHNAAMSHQKIKNARNALLRAKDAHNELVALTKRHKTFSSFTRRTNALNEASHCYGINTLKKLTKEVKTRMSKTW